MDILYLLIPFSVVLVLLIVAVFGWAVNSGQLDGFEMEAERILLDKDQGT
ncbi:cbb3-type cytochrome oxidase assembly protein CcoS [Roseateles sp. P5_E7]